MLFFCSLPVNGSKCVEVLHHDPMKVFEAVQFPEVVQVDQPVFPLSGNLIERPDNAAALRVCLPDDRHAAAGACTWCYRLLCPGQRQPHRSPTHMPPGHLRDYTPHSALSWTATPAYQAKKKGGRRPVHIVRPTFVKAAKFNQTTKQIQCHHVEQQQNVFLKVLLKKYTRTWS